MSNGPAALRHACPGAGYELEQLARMFLPGLTLREGPCSRGALVLARAGRRRLVAAARLEGRVHLAQAPRPAADAEVKPALSRLLYGVLVQATGQRPPWGMLTGVRPVRYWRRSSAALGAAEARQLFLEGYDLRPEKLALLEEVDRRQAPLLADTGEDDYSLYVSIPFCPTRCRYCSFVSQAVEREGGLVEPYLEHLLLELDATAALAKARGLRLRSIYIGGGTPTALPARLLARLLERLDARFGFANAAEVTCEAGRPDCTDAEKLRILRQAGVTRLSINPQTMAQPLLDAIGRRHTPEDIRRCFAEAREAGHDNINMDLIAGLPGDDGAAFRHSVEALLALGPENLTLHTLTLKKGSALRGAGEMPLPSPEAQAAMLDEAYGRLAAAGYAPYYLYRQKSTPGKLENTGWTKPGREGRYNMYIMEEVHSILATGAGASTKWVAGGGARIQRSFNPKYAADYIRSHGQVLAQKEREGKQHVRNLDTQETG